MEPPKDIKRIERKGIPVYQISPFSNTTRGTPGKDGHVVLGDPEKAMDASRILYDRERIGLAMVGQLPKVQLLATGGTIANPPDLDGYLTGQELVSSIPELSDVASLTVSDIARTGSSGVTPTLWYDLHDRIQAATRGDEGPDGFVVTHGSNTAEETAYFLNLTVDTARPIVVTAAQRNHSTHGYDGGANLVDAIRVAGHPDATGRGSLLVVNEEIHQARDVTKTVSGRPDAWTSADLGPVGLIDRSGFLQFYRRSERRHAPNTDFDISGTEADSFPRVEIIYSATGADGAIVDAAVERGPDGLVIAGLPTGAAAKPKGGQTQADSLERAIASGMPVAMSHRGMQGWPNRSILEESSFIWGDTLRPQKARILLALGLLETSDTKKLQEFFLEY